MSQMPSAPESEKNILGSALQSEKALNKLLQKIAGKHFNYSKNRVIFNAIKNIYADNRQVDQLTLIQYLRDNNLVTKAGGTNYATSLVDYAPSPVLIDDHIKVVKEKYMAGEMIKMNNKIQSELRNGADPKEEANKLSTFLMNIEHIDDDSKPFYSYNEAMQDAIEHTERLYNEEDTMGIKTGYVDFDNMTGGYQTGLHLIGARPSMGKTSWALNQTLHMAKNDYKIGVISLETEKGWLALRHLSGEAGINSHKFNVGGFNQSEFTRLIKKADEMGGKYQIWIDDSFDGKCDTVIAKLRAMKKIKDIDIAFVDYLQLMDKKGSQNRNLEIGNISREIKRLTKPLGIPIIAIVQLNRLAEGKMPCKSHLRDSGELEQNADTITFLWRPEEDDMSLYDGEPTDNIAWVKVAKWRNGRKGIFRLTWRPEYTRFENFSYNEAGF
jgi:replicative DNA helicase